MSLPSTLRGVKICDRSPEGQEAVRMEGTAQLEPFERRLHDKTQCYPLHRRERITHLQKSLNGAALSCV
jgi:hypothetical protein